MNNKQSKMLHAYGLRTSALAVIALVLLLAWPIAAAAQDTLYMPILQSSDAANTGLAFSNPALSQTTVTLTARDYTGALISGTNITNPRSLTLSGAGQRAQLANEIFGTGIAGRTGWVEVALGHPQIRGFFTVFDSILTQVDGAELQARLSNRIVFPKISTRQGSVTSITYINGSSQSMQAVLSLYANSGQLVSQRTFALGTKAGFSGTITQALAAAVPEIDGYAVLERGLFGAAESLAGFESYRNSGDNAVLNAVPASDLLRTGYMAQLASQSGYRTRVSLVNYTGSIQTVHVTAAGLQTFTGAIANSTRTVVRTLPAFGRIEETVDQMFSISGGDLITGYVYWTTQGDTNGVIGYVDYGTTDGILLSAVPAQGTAYSDLFFSHIAEGPGYYTGIALLNPNSSPSTVSVEAFNLQGQSVASAVVGLLAGERRAKLLPELFRGFTGQFGGYIRVSATRPVFASQLFGSPSLTFLANIAAQGIQLPSQASGSSVEADTGAVVLSPSAGASLIIHPGALAANTPITLQSVSLPGPSSTQSLVASVRALPSGTLFEIPARLVVTLATQLPAGAKLDLLIYDETTMQFIDSGFDATVDDYGRTATAYVTHFTDYGASVPTPDVVVSNLSPATGPAGTTLTITGSGFASATTGNVVKFAGSATPTVQAVVTAVSVDQTQMTVTVPAGAVSGHVIVQVGDKSSIGSAVSLFTVTSTKPVPVVDTITPASILVGATALELRISGTDFDSTSVARVDGVSYPTTVVDSTLILASLSGAALNVGAHAVTVFSPAPGGGTSTVKDFLVGYPTPVMTSLSIQSAEAGPTGVEITITGTGFLSNSTVLVNGVAQTTTFVNATTLRVSLSSNVGATRLLSVSNPTPGGGVSNTLTFVFTDPPIGSIVLISQAETSAAAGSTVQFTVEFRNTNGQPFPGATASLTVTTGGGSVPASGASNDQGRLTATLTLGVSPGLNRVNILAGGAFLDVDVTAVVGAASKLTLTASPASFVAGSAGRSLSARIEDAFGNLRTADTLTVNFAVTAGTGSLSAPSAAAVGGIATVTLTSNTAGTITVQGTSGALTAGNLNVTVTPGSPSSMTATGGTGQTANAGQTLGTPIKVQIKDAFNNVISGVTVNFSVVSGGGSITPLSTTTNASGESQATPTLGGTVGTQTFRAASSGLSSVDFNVTVNPAAPASLTLSTNSGTMVAGASGPTLTATIKDSFGNTVTSAANTITLTSSPSGSVTYGATMPMSPTSGVAQSTFSATTARTYTVTASSGALTPASVDIAVTAASAANLSLVSGNSQSGTKTLALAAPLVVKVTDTYGNTVTSGVTVTFSATSGGGSVNPNTAQSLNGSGQASTTATLGSAVGANQFTATSSPSLTGSPVTFDATATEAPPSTVSIIAGDNQKVAPGISLLTKLKARVTNTLGGAVVGATVNWAAASGGGSVSAPSSTTDSNGDAEITATVGGSVGANTFTATVGGLTPATFSATAENLTTTPTTVTVNISSGATAIGSYQVQINYNKDLVTLSSGNVAGGNGAGFTGPPISVNIDNVLGNVIVNHLQTSSSPSGNFTVVTLTFTPIRAGTSGLTIQDIVVTNTASVDVSTSFLTLSTSSLTIN